MTCDEAYIEGTTRFEHSQPTQKRGICLGPGATVVSARYALLAAFVGVQAPNGAQEVQIVPGPF